MPASVKPTISSVTATPVNGNSTINGWKIYVYGKTKAALAISGAAGAYGSTIRSYSITTSPNIGSSTASSFTTSEIFTTGTVTVTATVTDSRGRTASKTASFSVYAYAAPYFTSVEGFRCNSGGVRDDANGTYARIQAAFGCSALNGSNKVTATVALLQVGGSYATSSALTSGTGVTLGGGNLAVDASFNATLTLRDTVGTVSTYTLTIPSISYIMHVKRGREGARLRRRGRRGQHGDLRMAAQVEHEAGGIAGRDGRRQCVQRLQQSGSGQKIGRYDDR